MTIERDAEIVIGCRCDRRDVSHNNEFMLSLKTAFPITYEYISELYEQFYTCPFCQTTLIIPPAELCFFLDIKNCHFNFLISDYYIHFSTNNAAYSIPIKEDPHIASDFLANYQIKFGEKGNPTESEIRMIQKMARTINRKDWQISFRSYSVKKEIKEPSKIWMN